MPIMSQADADALAARGAITPEQHAAISEQNGVSSPLDAGAPVASAPPPIADAGPPPAALPDASTLPLDGGVSAAPPVPVETAAPPAPLPLSNGPWRAPMRDVEPDVVVGPSTPVVHPAGAPSVAGMTDAQLRGQLGLTGGTNAPVVPKATTGAVDKMNADVGGLKNTQTTQAALNDIHGKSAADEEAAHASMQADIAMQNAQAAAKRAEDAAALQKRSAETDAAVEDYRNTHVNPNRVAQGRGVGGTALAALAMGLGAFGSAITHAPNYAQQILDKQTDDDIRAQEGEIAKKGKAVDMKSNSLAAYRQIIGDDTAARLLTKADKMEEGRNAIAAIVEKRGNAEERERGMLALKQVDTSIADVRAQYKIAKEQADARHAAAAAARAEHLDDKKWARAKDVKEGQQKDKALETDALKAVIEGRKADPSGKAAEQKAAEDDAALRTKLKAVNAAWNTAVESNYDSRLTEKAGKFVDSDNHSVNSGALSQLVGVVKGVGDNSEQDAERLKDMLPKPGDNEATLARKRAMLNNKVFSQHPQAAERFAAAQVPTVAVPGEGK